MKSKILKNLKILYKGIIGIGTEFLYVIVLLSQSLILCGLIYLFIFKK